MRLSLVQVKQNRLYDFLHAPELLSKNEAHRLAEGMAEQTLSLMEQASPCDLIVTTEAINYPGRPACLSGNYADYVDAAQPEERFADFARKRGCYVLADLYVKRAGKLYNEAIVFDRSGQVVARYDKIHLAGEEQQTLQAGSEYCVVDADFGRFGIAICWDMQFPEVCRHYALANVHLVVCPTWGWESIYSHARAYENGIYVAGAMSVPYEGGISGIRTPSEIIAPDGSILAVGSPDRAGIVSASFNLSSDDALYQVRMHDRRPDTYGALICAVQNCRTIIDDKIAQQVVGDKV